MKNILIFSFFIISNFMLSQEANQIKIGLKENHYAKYSSVVLTKDEKRMVTSDESGKILIFKTTDFNYEKTIKTGSGIPISGMRLVKNDSVLMVSQKYDYSDGTTDSLIMISLHNNKILLKEQRKFTFLGNIKRDVIISNTSDYYDSVIEIFESNFNKITKFKTDQDVKIVELSTNKKKVIYTEGNLVFQNKIIIRDVATNSIDKQFPIDEKVTIVHLFFDENSEFFYAVGYIESEKKINVYKYNGEINWDKPIFSTPFEGYYSDNIVSDIVLNKVHHILFTSKSWHYEKPMLLKCDADKIAVTTIEMEKSPSHSLQIPSKNQIVFFQNFNSNFSDIAGFYVYDYLKNKVVETYPKITAGFYVGTFLPNNNWMVIGKNANNYSENIKYYTAGTFNNRFGKLNIKDYLEVNHNILDYSFKLFIDRNTGSYIFNGAEKGIELTNKKTYYKYDLIQDKVIKIVDDAGNFHHVLDFNKNDNTLLLSENEYTFNSTNSGYKLKFIRKSDSTELKGLYKIGKLSNDGSLLLTINDKNGIEIRQVSNNKVVFNQQLDDGNYSVLSLGNTAFIVSVEYRKLLPSNCVSQTFVIDSENGIIKSNVKDCAVVNDASFADEKIAMIINNQIVVANEKVLIFKGNEFPQMISYNENATKLMVSFKNGSIIIYDAETLKEEAKMIHPNQDRHLFYHPNGYYFSNVDAEDYLYATQNGKPVTLKSIENIAFKPEKILSIFGKPNADYVNALDKATKIREDNKTESLVKNENSAQKEKESGNPNLYIVTIGVSDYKQSNFNLTFADKDALDIAKIYGKLDDKDLIAYKDKFFGYNFNEFEKQGEIRNNLKKYLGNYISLGDFYHINAKENIWAELNNNIINIWDFNNKKTDSLQLPENFEKVGWEASKKIISYPGGTGFVVLGTDSKILSYNLITKETKIISIPFEFNFENFKPLNEKEWLFFSHESINDSNVIKIKAFNVNTNQVKERQSIVLNFYVSKVKETEDEITDLKSYCIVKFHNLSETGKHIVYTISDDAVFVLPIENTNSTLIKVPIKGKLDYSSEVSVSDNLENVSILNTSVEDYRYQYTILNTEGKVIEEEKFKDDDFTLVGFSIKNAKPRWIQKSAPLLENDVFNRNSDDVLSKGKPYSFETIYVKHLINKEASAIEVKNTLAEFFTKSKSNDQILVFLAGHGVLDNNKQYYFAPHDMDFNNVTTNGVSFDFIVNCLKNAPATNKLLMMDSCHSGNTLDVVNGSTKNDSKSGSNEQRGSVGSSIKSKDNFKVSEIISTLFEDFLSKSGVTILSASSGSDVAYENKQIGNGAFTAAYMKLLKDKFNSFGIIDEEDLKKPIKLTKEDINVFFKQVMLYTQNKQVPDIREINELSEIKIW